MTVALLFVLVIFVPVVDGINHSQTETIEHDTGDANPTDAYTKTWEDTRGNIAPKYRAVRGTYDSQNNEFTPRNNGTTIQVPIQGAYDEQWTFKVAKDTYVRFSNAEDILYDGTPAVVTHDWSIQISVDPDNADLGIITVTQPGTNGDNMMYVDYILYYTHMAEQTRNNSSYTNDTRGNFDTSTMTFTADANGDYILIDWSNIGQTYYVWGNSQSVIYVPDANDDYIAYTVVNGTGLNSAVTLSFTDASTLGQLKKMTGSTTDNTLKGIIIPYTVTYTDMKKENYGHNDPQNGIEQVFTPDESGNTIKVPGQVLADNNTYYSNGQYYGAVNGVLIQLLASNPQNIDDMTLTIDHISEYVYSFEGSGTGYLYVRYGYTNPEFQSDHNTLNSVTNTYTPVRGNMAGDIFTPDADGAYIQVYGYNIIYGDYQIGEGQKYYMIVGGTVTEYTAPTRPLTEMPALDIAPAQGEEHVYDLDIIAMFDDTNTIVLPYEVSWTETKYVEVIPMEGILIVTAIIACLMVGVSAVVTGGKL